MAALLSAEPMLLPALQRVAIDADAGRKLDWRTVALGALASLPQLPGCPPKLLADCLRILTPYAAATPGAIAAELAALPLLAAPSAPAGTAHVRLSDVHSTHAAAIPGAVHGHLGNLRWLQSSVEARSGEYPVSTYLVTFGFGGAVSLRRSFRCIWWSIYVHDVPPERGAAV